jgi:putative endonuclease
MALSSRSTRQQQLGSDAEQRALLFLIEHGCEPIGLNERAKVGELDLIVRDGTDWVFVEVRSRASVAFGGAAASVTSAKQAKIRKAAQVLLLRRFGQRPWPGCRFDVIAIQGGQLNWIKNAF